jgi:glycosyltransferase involved in cell wall biosynthesis
MAEQTRLLDAEVVEICLGTATPITSDARVIDHRPLAPAVARPLRPPLRHLDLLALRMAWRRAAMEADRTRPDVVFANSCQLLKAPLGLLDLRAPSLLFCDEPRRVDYEPEDTSNRNPRTRVLYRGLHAAERRLDRAAVAHATRLATNSDYAVGEIRKAYGRAAAVVRAGVAPTVTTPPGTPRHLLSVGSLSPDKGHDLAIRAAAGARRRWPLMVVAPRPHHAEEARLTGLAQDLGVALEIRVAIGDAELAQAYAEAQATIYLAALEPLGLVSLEAQACGSPVIVAAEGGLPETVVEGEGGWAVPRGPEAAAACIDRLDDPRLRSAMSAAARHHGGAASWRRSAEALRAVLEDCAGGARA